MSGAYGPPSAPLAGGVPLVPNALPIADATGRLASGPSLGRDPFSVPVVGARLRQARHELSQNAQQSSAPAGIDKPLVIMESRGQAGVLTKIWATLSTAGADPGPMESTGFIQVFLDDGTTPSFTIQVNDFFCAGTNGGVFATPKVGRSWRANYATPLYQSGQYRYLWAPYSRYCRVEYVNRSTSVPNAWLDAEWYDLPTPHIGPLQSYTIYGSNAVYANGAWPIPYTVCDIAGAGQVESFWVTGLETGANVSWKEGNLEIYIDNETVPSIVCTGTEDAFGGAFYSVPVGGYPMGASGAASATPGGAASLGWYRFFVDDPITFKTHLKIVQNIGQLGQSSGTGAVTAGVYAGVWLNTAKTVQPFPTTGALLYTAPFNTYSAGALPSPWFINPSGTQWQGGSNVASFTDATALDRYAMLPRSTFGTDDYRIEARVRITDTSTGDEQVGIAARTTPANPTNTTGVWLKVSRTAQYSYYIQLNDVGVNLVGKITSINRGQDLLSQDIDLALELQGSAVRAYFKWAGDAYWQPVARTTTTLTTGSLGLRCWTFAGSVSSFNVYALANGT